MGREWAVCQSGSCIDLPRMVAWMGGAPPGWSGTPSAWVMVFVEWRRRGETHSVTRPVGAAAAGARATAERPSGQRCTWQRRTGHMRGGAERPEAPWPWGREARREASGPWRCGGGRAAPQRPGHRDEGGQPSERLRLRPQLGGRATAQQSDCRKQQFRAPPRGRAACEVRRRLGLLPARPAPRRRGGGAAGQDLRAAPRRM